MLGEKRFDTGAVVINYAEGPANGDPFVVLHGGAGSWQYGAALIEALSARWHVYAPDLRGHGRSSRVPGRYRLRDYAADTAAFLEQVVEAPAILYGHSLGGETAMMVAAQRPELVRAVVNADGPLSVDDRRTEDPNHRAMNELWHRLAGRPVEEIAAALKDMPVPVRGEEGTRPAREVFGEDNPWFAFQAENLHRLDPDMLAAVLEGPEVLLEGYEAEKVLPKIRCPVLILQADPAAGGLLDAEVERAMRLLPHAIRLRMEGMGHELHGPPGQERRVLEAITPFLEGV